MMTHPYLKPSHFEYSSYAAHKVPEFGHIKLESAVCVPSEVYTPGRAGPVLATEKMLWQANGTVAKLKDAPERLILNYYGIQVLFSLSLSYFEVFFCVCACATEWFGMDVFDHILPNGKHIWHLWHDTCDSALVT